MRESWSSWLAIVDRVLRPKRPHLERCERERAPHLEARQRSADRRAHAMADCARRIDELRAVVFAANDGVVSARMTELEREWRLHARTEPDVGCMDLWARIAPHSWIDRKPWRDSPPASRVDAAIALAADIEAVELAEAAARTSTGRTRVRFKYVDRDVDSAQADELLAAPLRAAWHTALGRDGGSFLVERARSVAAGVLAAANARLPSRPLLSGDLAYAAFADVLGVTEVTPLRALWSTGYVIHSIDATSVTLEIPRL